MRKSIVLAVVLAFIGTTAVMAAEANDANQGAKTQQVAKASEPIGWWKLDEKDGNVAQDSSGNGFHATVQPGKGPAIWAAGEGVDSGNCAKFTAQQIVLIPNRLWGRVKEQLTISFWINQDPENPAGESWPGPWGCAQTEGLSYPAANWLPLRAFMPTPNNTIDIGKDEEHVFWETPDANAYAGKWNHYVFVKDANEQTLKLYHNGEKVAETYGATEPIPKINNFFLGGRTHPTPDWNGKIDDFRIYNTALTSEEIRKIYENKAKK